MAISDAFLMGIQPGLQAFTGLPAAGAPAPPIVMTPENQAAMLQPGPSAAAPDPNLPQGLIPGVANTGMSGGPAFVPGQPPPMPPPVEAAGPAPSEMAPPAPMPDQRPVMSTMGGAPAREFMKQGPKQLEAMEKRLTGEQQGLQDVTEIRKGAALKEAMAARVAQDEAQRRIDAAAAAQQKEDALMQASAQKVAAASAPLNKPIEDYWSDKSVGQKVGMALSVAIGAFSGAFSKTGANPAMQILQSSIEQDARTKQMNFQRGVAVKDAAQQDFNNLAKQIGLNPASDAYKAAMRDKLAAKAQEVAATAKLPEIQADATQMATQLRSQGLKELQNSVLGYKEAQKGTPTVLDPALGGVPISAKDYGEYQVKRALKRDEQEGDLQIAAAKEGQKKTAEGTKYISDKMQAADIPATLSAIDAAAQEFKKGNDKGTGAFARTVKAGLGERAYSAFYGEDASKREQDWGMLKAQIMKSITGAGMSDTERERYDAILDGARTPEARIHSIQRAREAIVKQKETIEAGAGPEAAAQFDANLKAVSAPKIKSTPAKR